MLNLSEKPQVGGQEVNGVKLKALNTEGCQEKKKCR